MESDVGGDLFAAVIIVGAAFKSWSVLFDEAV
jgi:hypothetical protein